MYWIEVFVPNGISSTPRLKSNAIQFLQGIFLFYLNGRKHIESLFKNHPYLKWNKGSLVWVQLGDATIDKTNKSVSIPLGLARLNSWWHTCLHIKRKLHSRTCLFKDSIGHLRLVRPSIPWSRIKGQIISKCFFGVFNFLQKTNENTSHTSKNKFICSFFGRIQAWQFAFEINWPPAPLHTTAAVHWYFRPFSEMDKGELISKELFGILNSSKKWTKKFNLTTMIK